MAVNANNFILKYPEWEGLDKLAGNLERRAIKKEERDQQALARKQASATFLDNYLDPKQYLSGTAYDPMIVKGIQNAKIEGAKLASQGVDAATMMMALGPLVNQLSDYSIRAKTVNAQVDDTIKNMKASGYEGYDFAKLKDTALQQAFFNTDPQTGQPVLDPTKADPSVNWAAKAIDASPELVTTGGDLDAFAKQSPMNKSLSDIRTFDQTGKESRQKVHMTGQNWLVPDENEKGETVGMVPKYEIATDGGQPLMHTFKDEAGKDVSAPVRMLDEALYDSMVKSKPGVNDYFRGLVKTDLEKLGKDIPLNSPEAKRMARTFAYDELKRRKTSSIENAEVQGKPSAAQVNLNVQSSPQGLQFIEDRAEATARGRTSVTGMPGERTKGTNVFQAIGNVMTNKPEFLEGDVVPVNGKNVIDVTAAMPGGGLKKGIGEDEKYKSVYYDPKDRNLIVETQETGKKGQKATITEPEIGPFMYKIAEANGVDRAEVRKWLNQIGYKDGRFTQVGNNAEAMKRLEAKKTPDDIEVKIKEFEEKGNVDRLKKFKGQVIDGNEIVLIEGDYVPFSGKDYRVKLKGPDGKTFTKGFETKKDLTTFLRGKAGAPVKKPETKSSSKEVDYRNKYGY